MFEVWNFEFVWDFGFGFSPLTQVAGFPRWVLGRTLSRRVLVNRGAQSVQTLVDVLFGGGEGDSDVVGGEVPEGRARSDRDFLLIQQLEGEVPAVKT